MKQTYHLIFMLDSQLFWEFGIRYTYHVGKVYNQMKENKAIDRNNS